MTDEIKSNIDLSDDISSEWVAANFKFAVGDSSLPERLAAVQKLVGGATKLSAGIGVSLSGVKSWISRGTEPGILKMAQLSQFSGASVRYLADGQIENDRDIDCEMVRLDEYLRGFNYGSRIRERMPRVKVKAAAVRENLEAIRRTIQTEVSAPSDDIVQIPRFDVRAAAGAGALALSEGVSSYFSVERDWLRRMMPGWAPTNAQVGILEVSGDSMFPTLSDGDLVIAISDPPERIVDNGGIFFVRHHGHLRVKRLHVDMRTGDISLISDNQHYPVEVVHRNDLEHELQILASVFIRVGKLRQ